MIDTEAPPVRFYSFRRDAPMPHPCDRYELHPAADPLCRPHIEALAMGLQMDAPLSWALTRTEAGMRVGWIRDDDSIAWQNPDEHGNVYHPEGPEIFEGFPIESTRAKKILVPGKGLQFANVKPTRPGFIEVISGWLFDSPQGWGLRVGWPSGTPMPDGLAEVPHAYFRPWYQAPFPTVFRIDQTGVTVRFYRGDTMAALVPLPDAVREGSRTDGRVASNGVKEWPRPLRARVGEVTDQIYRRRGGYSATTHRTDRSGVCPFTAGEQQRDPKPVPDNPAKRLLAATLDGLAIPYEYGDNPAVLVLYAGEHSTAIATDLTAAGSPATRIAIGIELSVGDATQNGRALAVLAADGRIPRRRGPLSGVVAINRARQTWGQLVPVRSAS